MRMTKDEKEAIRKATSKAGKASAQALTPKERKERSRKAIAARWAKKKGKK